MTRSARVKRGTRGGDRAAEPTRAIGIIGLGLIGGSLARALHARFPGRRLVGVEPNPKTRRLARRTRAFDAVIARPAAQLRKCGIVVLCAPVTAILRLLSPVSRWMSDGAVLTDVGGVKQPILAAARIRVRSGVSFVGAHPMFGGERGGYEASRPDLWKGGVVAVCSDTDDSGALREIARLHRALGARVILCTAARHDAAVALVSHLPYVVASALALTVRGRDPLIRRLAARGLWDTTRPAAFAYAVQGEAARANPSLLRVLRDFERRFRRLRRVLASSKSTTGRQEFTNARRARKFLLTSVAPAILGRSID